MSTDLDTERAFALIAELANDVAFDPSARLRNIGFDSLAFTELASALQESSGLDLAGADLSDLSTVDDVLRAVELARRGVPATGVPAGIGRSQPFAKAAGGWAFRWWFRLEVIGAEHVPRRGAVVMAMNHESALDVPRPSWRAPDRSRSCPRRSSTRTPSLPGRCMSSGGSRSIEVASISGRSGSR